jgi:Secretion system C-terminal sorting domain
VWYSFNALGNDVVTINLSMGTIGDIGIEVLDGCGGTSLFCDFSALTYDVPVTPGAGYVVRVFSNNEFGAGGTFGICISADFSTGVQSAPTSSFSVFPNPTEGNLSLSWNGTGGKALVELMDMTGRMVLSEQHTVANGNTIALQVPNGLAAGSYSLRVTVEGRQLRQNVLVR